MHRHRLVRRLAAPLSVLLLLLGMVVPSATSGAVTSISLDLVASGLDPLTQVTSAAAVLMGCLVLIGWLLDVEGLKAILRGRVAMNPATAQSRKLRST